MNEQGNLREVIHYWSEKSKESLRRLILLTYLGKDICILCVISFHI